MSHFGVMVKGYRQTKTESAQKNFQIVITNFRRTIRPNACSPAGFKLRGSLIGTSSLHTPTWL